MSRSIVSAAALAAASLASGAALPAAAQVSGQKSASPPPHFANVLGPNYGYTKPWGRTRWVAGIANVPGYGNVHIVPVPPIDERSARQRCLDEEIAAAGGSRSTLAMGVIDLKCSQR
jgi:hypothetical protein